MIKFILITVVLLFWLFYIYRKKKSLIYPSTFLLLLYVISVALAYPHVIINNETLSLKPEYFQASLFFLLLIFVYFLPILSFREDKISKIVLPNATLLYYFSIVIVILSIFSIFYFLPVVIRVFQMGDLNFARINMTEGNIYVSETIFNTIASVSASLYTIAMILFFIYRVLGTNKILSNLLLISSTSYVLNVFAYVGRDGVVFWLFSFIGVYGLFKNFLQKNDIKIIKKIFIYFSVIAIPFFLAITFDRFAENPFAGMLSYIGQSFPNFCLFYNLDRPITNGSSFPLFRSMLGLDVVQNERWMEGGTVSWVFGTFFKSFVSNFGRLGTLFIGIILSSIFLLIFKLKSRTLYFHQLFVFYLYFMVFTQGVFYFRQYTRGGNLFIILSFVFYFLFLFIRKNHNINSLVLYSKLYTNKSNDETTTN